MKRAIMIAVLAVMCCGQTYAGGLEGERVNSGVRFGESVMTDEAPAVRMSGDFRAAPKVALTADLQRETNRVNVPAIGTPSNKDVVSGAAVGSVIGVWVGAAIGIIGAVIAAVAIGCAIGGPLGVLAAIGICVFGGVELGGSVGGLLGAAIGAGIGAIAGAFTC